MTALQDAMHRARRLTRNEKSRLVRRVKPKSLPVSLPAGWFEDLIAKAIQLDASKLKPIDQVFEWDKPAKAIGPTWPIIKGKRNVAGPA